MVASFGALAFGSCSCCEAVLAAEDWSYGGPSGPPTWTGTCATGAKQSPIDVNMRKITLGQATLGELVFDYKPSTPTFTNPGHGTMEVLIHSPLIWLMTTFEVDLWNNNTFAESSGLFKEH